jgi:hypothetical protein
MTPVYRKLFWTEHSKIKMKQYGLSKQKLLGILYRPERKEHGIVPGTTAVMKTNKIFFGTKQITISKAWQKPKKSPGEIWLMFRDTKDLRKIISAWRYPGTSKPGEEIPIPQDILNEIQKEEYN